MGKREVANPRGDRGLAYCRMCLMVGPVPVVAATLLLLGYELTSITLISDCFELLQRVVSYTKSLPCVCEISSNYCVPK